MATVRFCCHGNVPSGLTLHFLPIFWEIQPLLLIGWARLESFRLKSPWRQSVSVQLWNKTFTFSLMLVSPSPPAYDSLSPPLFSPLSFLEIVVSQSLHHITVSLWTQFTVSFPLCLLSGGVQATAANTSQPEPGSPEHRATPGQGKNWSHIIWTLTPVTHRIKTVVDRWKKQWRVALSNVHYCFKCMNSYGQSICLRYEDIILKILLKKISFFFVFIGSDWLEDVGDTGPQSQQ